MCCVISLTSLLLQRTRQRASELTVRKVLECLFGLLLSPDTADPLDSTLALLFYDSNGQYEADLMSHTAKVASTSRAEWLARFAAQVASAEESIASVRESLSLGSAATASLLGVLESRGEGGFASSSSSSSASSSMPVDDSPVVPVVSALPFAAPALARSMALLAPYLIPAPAPAPADTVAPAAPATEGGMDTTPQEGASTSTATSSSASISSGGDAAGLLAEAEGHYKAAMATVLGAEDALNGAAPSAALTSTRRELQCLTVQVLYAQCLLHFGRGLEGADDARAFCDAAQALARSHAKPLGPLPAAFVSLFELVRLHMDALAERWSAATSKLKSLQSALRKAAATPPGLPALFTDLLDEVAAQAASFKASSSRTASSDSKKPKKK